MKITEQNTQEEVKDSKIPLNYYKIITLIGICIVIILIAVIVYKYESAKTIYKLGDVEISQEDFNSISKEMQNFSRFRICNIQEDKCVMVRTLP
jgi:Na+-transporting NADH:ubiquinone oxidoreductase subunit NqrA